MSIEQFPYSMQMNVPDCFFAAKDGLASVFVVLAGTAPMSE